MSPTIWCGRTLPTRTVGDSNGIRRRISSSVCVLLTHSIRPHRIEINSASLLGPPISCSRGPYLPDAGDARRERVCDGLQRGAHSACHLLCPLWCATSLPLHPNLRPTQICTACFVTASTGHCSTHLSINLVCNELCMVGHACHLSLDIVARGTGRGALLSERSLDLGIVSSRRQAWRFSACPRSVWLCP